MANQKEDISINLPAAVVTRIVKDSLPDGCNIAKEAKLALARAATVFVLYLTASSNNVALERNKKTITNRDVLEALQLTEFGRFEEPLTEALERFRQKKEIKKAKKNENSMSDDMTVVDVADKSDSEALEETNDDEAEDVDMEDDS